MPDFFLGQRDLGSRVEDDAIDRRRRHQDRPGLPVIAKVARDISRDDAGSLQRFGNIDLVDSRMCHLAAQQRGVQHARQFDVVDEQGLAGEEPAVLVALDRFAEGAGGHLASAPHPFRRRHHGIDDVLVTGAAAQIAGQRLAHLVFAG